jgi:hypothetical protein
LLVEDLGRLDLQRRQISKPVQALAGVVVTGCNPSWM